MFSLGRILFRLALAATLISCTISAQPGPDLQWKFAAKGPIISSPMIDNGLVYFGSLDSHFYAIDLGTGSRVWDFATGGEIRSTAAMDRSALYFVSGDGQLYALDKVTGKMLWSFAMEFEKQYDFADYYQSSPVLVNRVVYCGSGDGCVYAIKAADGSLVWKFKTGDVVHATPALSGDKLFVGSFDGYFYALQVSSGELVWKFKSVGHRFFPKGEFMGSPAVGPSLVYVGARDYNLYALDQEKGYCHWNKSFTRGWALANTVRDSIVYTGTSDDRLLIASGIRSGREFWRTEMGFNLFGGVAFDSSIGYVGTLIGKLYAVNLATGAILWSYSTQGYLDNHLKYFKEDDSFRDDIFEIVKSDEAFIEVEHEIGAIFSTAAVTAEYVLVTSTDGSLYCLRKPATH